MARCIKIHFGVSELLTKLTTNNNEKFSIPDIQRELEHNKVLEIMNCFIEKHKKNDNYFIHHGFTLSLCVIDNDYSKYWVIDGQHRLEAIKKLSD